MANRHKAHSELGERESERERENERENEIPLHEMMIQFALRKLSTLRWPIERGRERGRGPRRGALLRVADGPKRSKEKRECWGPLRRKLQIGVAAAAGAAPKKLLTLSGSERVRSLL